MKTMWRWSEEAPGCEPGQDASITTALDLYGHLYPGDVDRYADRLDTAADEVSSSGTRATDEFR
jgi:hypothetical protein